ASIEDTAQGQTHGPVPAHLNGRQRGDYESLSRRGGIPSNPRSNSNSFCYSRSIMKHLLKVFVVLALLALSGCVDEPTTVEPTAIPPAAETPTAAATQAPTEPSTAEPSTLLPPTETATPPSKLDPATLAPVTRGPSTEEPPTRAPLTPQPTMPGPAATETPPATK